MKRFFKKKLISSSDEEDSPAQNGHNTVAEHECKRSKLSFSRKGWTGDSSFEDEEELMVLPPKKLLPLFQAKQQPEASNNQAHFISQPVLNERNSFIHEKLNGSESSEDQFDNSTQANALPDGDCASIQNDETSVSRRDEGSVRNERDIRLKKGANYLEGAKGDEVEPVHSIPKLSKNRRARRKPLPLTSGSEGESDFMQNEMTVSVRKESIAANSEVVGTPERCNPPASPVQNENYSNNSEVVQITMEEVSSIHQEILQGRVIYNASASSKHSSTAPRTTTFDDSAKKRSPESLSDKLSIEQRWKNEISSKLYQMPDFFNGRDAKMLETEPMRKGQHGYQSVPVTHHNNHDMNYLYSLEYAAKPTSNNKYGSYEQLCVVAGQFIRMCISFQVIDDKNSACDKGRLFTAVLDRSALTTFLNYFKVRSSVCTVACKANHIIKLIEYSQVFFKDQNNEIMSGKVGAAQILVRSIRNAAKSASRKKATQEKHEEDRVLEGRIFFPEDFKLFMNVFSKALDGVIMKWSNLQKETGVGGSRAINRAPADFFKNQSLVDKWCLNFIGALVMGAAGQCPEVFWQLLTPTKVEMNRIEAVLQTQDYFELKVVSEKCERNINMPHPIFPRRVFKYIQFHVKHIRQEILFANDLSEKGSSVRPLLLHSKKGSMLSSHQITRSLKTALRQYDPEINNVSTMSLRASFATMMFHGYKDGVVMATLSEDKFLEEISRYMNTSVEQLRTTYILVGKEMFATSAQRIMKSLAEVTQSADTDSQRGMIDLSDFFG